MKDAISKIVTHIRSMDFHVQSTLILSLLLSLLFGFFPQTNSSAQRIGEQAEMDRLEKQAHNLAAQNDPEGAALAIGKAAMMADLLTEDSQGPAAEKFFQGASHHFRAQELGLRALALFERAGGQPPAPAGVCHYLVQGNHKLRQAKKFLEETPAIHQEELQVKQKNFLEKNAEWEELLLGLHKDFACPHNLHKK